MIVVWSYIPVWNTKQQYKNTDFILKVWQQHAHTFLRACKALKARYHQQLLWQVEVSREWSTAEQRKWKNAQLCCFLTRSTVCVCLEKSYSCCLPPQHLYPSRPQLWVQSLPCRNDTAWVEAWHALNICISNFKHWSAGGLPASLPPAEGHKVGIAC